MDTHQYAKSCVAHVISGDSWCGLVTKRWVWEGKMSWLVWVGWTYLPRGVMDWYFTNKFKLNSLRGTVGPDKKTV